MTGRRDEPGPTPDAEMGAAAQPEPMMMMVIETDAVTVWIDETELAWREREDADYETALEDVARIAHERGIKLKEGPDEVRSVDGRRYPATFPS